MPHTIAVAGKGGVGKTSLSALLVSRLIAHGRRPVLAVDADPNTCLDRCLGVEALATVGALRERLDEAKAAGMDKRRFLEFKIAESLVEGDDFDLIAMGRPEGAGCYCYANAVLKDVLEQIGEQYPYMVIDNEAGLENISRRIVARVDTLILVGDPSFRGLETIRRLHALAREMGLEYQRLALVVNRSKSAAPPKGLQELQETTGAEQAILLPEDDEISELDVQGRSLGDLPEDNPVVQGVDALLQKILDDEV